MPNNQTENNFKSDLNAFGADNEEFDITEFINVLRRRKKIIIVFGSIILSLSAIFTTYKRIFRPTYSGSFKLLISDPISKGKNNSSSGLSSSLVLNIANNSTVNDEPTLIALLKSPLVLQPLADQYDLSVLSLERKISIKNQRIGNREADGVLEINLRSQNLKKGTNILNSLSERYLKTANELKQQRLKDGLIFLNEQTPILYKKTKDLQNKLANYRKANSFLEPIIEGRSLSEQKLASQEKILFVNSSIRKLGDIKKKLIEDKLSPTEFKELLNYNNQKEMGVEIKDSDSGFLIGILQVEEELAKARLIYTEDSEPIKNLKLKQKKLIPLIKESQIKIINNAIKQNKNDLEVIIAENKEIKKRFEKQPDLIKEYNAIKGELEIAAENLSGIISAKENFQLEMAQNNVPWKIISPPIMDPVPIEPSFSKNFILALIAGSALGIFAAFIRDIFDNVFNSSEEVKIETNIPNLAHMPYVEQFEDIRVNKKSILGEINNFSKQGEENYQSFFYLEALRNLYTSIRFLNSDKNIKTLIITSSIPGEGKSLLNILFAKTLSEIGLKVLLVDTDMRKPVIHERLNINNIRGLSNYLTGDKKDLKKFIQKVPGFENFSVLTAGKKAPDPTRLLGSERMRTFMQEIKKDESFDLIVFDTPPILELSDALIISNETDGIILLVSLNNVKRPLPKRCIEKIEKSKTTILGTITNRIYKPIKKMGSDFENDTYSQYASYANANIETNLNNENEINIKSSSESEFQKRIRKYINIFFNWIDN